MIVPLLVAHLNLVQVHDDGRYANSPLKAWFDSLGSKRGLCCSFADGITLKGVDWRSINDPKKSHVHFQVQIKGKWWDVPDDAVLTVPNRAGRTIVWPVFTYGGNNKLIDVYIRCFLPGAMI